MTGGQHGELDAPVQKEWISAKKKRPDARLYKLGKGRIDVICAAGLRDQHRQPTRPGRGMHVGRIRYGIWICRIN